MTDKKARKQPIGASVMTEIPLARVDQCQDIKGVAFSEATKFRQFLAVGPPGAGKSSFVRRIGGWPEEGYINLAIKRWWASQSLAMRPREVHFGLPFVGCAQSYAVFDREWLDADPPLKLDLTRILIPPAKKHFLSVDWKARFVFEFLLPDPVDLYQRRVARAEAGTHVVDRDLSMETVTRQIEIYERVALHFHRNGMSVFLRGNIDDPPMRIADELHVGH